LHLFIQLADKLRPILQANLEYFPVLDLGDAEKVKVAMFEEIPIWKIFDELFPSVPAKNESPISPTLRCFEKKLSRKRARFWMNSWSLELLLGYSDLSSTAKGTILDTVAKVSVNIDTSFSSKA